MLAVLAILAITGCTNRAKQAQECAQGFLNAYLENDFNAAASFCTPEFSVEFEKAMADFSNLEVQMQQMLKEQCAQLKANVLSVERVNESDTFTVNYTIVKAFPDSTSNHAAQWQINSTLKVIDGKVLQLNK